MISWTGLHNLADVIFRTTQKPFYIASSNLVRYIMYVIWIFLNLFCKLMRDHSLVSGPFSFFLWSCSLKGIGFETKNKVNFFKGFLIILFQNILFLKQFLECNSCFSLYCKIKKGSGTSCWCTFCAWFLNKKCYLFDTLIMDIVSMSGLISVSRYQTNCVIRLLLRQLMA